MTLSWLNDYNLLIFDRIDSTNSEAIRLAKGNVVDNIVIVAREQTAGKGQKNKPWQSISGNLHASILIKSDLSLNRLKEISFLTANILHKTVMDYINSLKLSKVDVKVKWPNDLLINDKKLAGILLESVRYNNKNYVIIGIGVNTHFVPKIENTSLTSLFNEGMILRHSDDFLSAFMVNWQYYYERWKTENSFANTRKEWLKNAYHLNKNITFNDGTQIVSGIFTGIDADGAICIKLSDGQIHSFSSGDSTY